MKFSDLMTVKKEENESSVKKEENESSTNLQASSCAAITTNLSAHFVKPLKSIFLAPSVIFVLSVIRRRHSSVVSFGKITLPKRIPSQQRKRQSKTTLKIPIRSDSS